MGVCRIAVEVGAVAGVGHAVAGAVGVVGVAGRAFTRICGSGPAADPGRVGEAAIGTVATRGAGDGAEGFVAIGMPDNVPVVRKVGSVILSGALVTWVA